MNTTISADTLAAATAEPRSPARSLAMVGILGAFVIGKAVIAAALYDPARVWLHQDDYCRALMSLEWGRHPYLHPADLHWLPFPFYVYGAASWLGGADAQRTFVIVSQVLAAITLLPVYGLTRTFFSRRAAVLACALYTFSAWQNVMSFSALGEPVYYLTALSGVHFFCRWWVRGQRRSLVTCGVFLALAALTRYETWVLLAMVTAFGFVRLYRNRSAGRIIWAAGVLLVVPWVGPAWWMLENVRAYGSPLVFYDANREALAIAAKDLEPETLRTLGRFFGEGCARMTSWIVPRACILWYPVAFVALSVPLTALLAVTYVRRRSWLGGRGGVLGALVLGHLGVLTLLYVAGSGPSFVMRIVLFHMLALLPFAGAALDRGLGARRGAVRVAVAAFLLLFSTSEIGRAHAIIAGRLHSDYRPMGDDYYRLSEYLRAEVPALDGDVAVQCHDDGRFVRVLSRWPWRMHNVKGEEAAALFDAQPIEMLCVAIGDLGPWHADARIEAAFRARHASQRLSNVEFGNWRVLRLDRR